MEVLRTLRQAASSSPKSAMSARARCGCSRRAAADGLAVPCESREGNGRRGCGAAVAASSSRRDNHRKVRNAQRSWCARQTRQRARDVRSASRIRLPAPFDGAPTLAPRRPAARLKALGHRLQDPIVVTRSLSEISRELLHTCSSCPRGLVQGEALRSAGEARRLAFGSFSFKQRLASSGQDADTSPSPREEIDAGQPQSG